VKSNEDSVLRRKTMRFGILVLGLLIPGAFGQAETFTGKTVTAKTHFMIPYVKWGTERPEYLSLESGQRGEHGHHPRWPAFGRQGGMNLAVFHCW
jgi:hypothetical protein